MFHAVQLRIYIQGNMLTVFTHKVTPDVNQTHVNSTKL